MRMSIPAMRARRNDHPIVTSSPKPSATDCGHVHNLPGLSDHALRRALLSQPPLSNLPAGGHSDPARRAASAAAAARVRARIPPALPPSYPEQAHRGFLTSGLEASIMTPIAPKSD